ncbi:MAG: hypothetical protein JXM71_08410, partial [Spirochaetales bacterium]|nr:hypothetical protein [Spirochaetales bacterium]
VERTRTDAWWRLSGGVRYGIAWTPVPSTQLFLTGRSTWPVLVGPAESLVDAHETALSVGIALPFKP